MLKNGAPLDNCGVLYRFTPTGFHNVNKNNRFLRVSKRLFIFYFIFFINQHVYTWCLFKITIIQNTKDILLFKKDFASWYYLNFLRTAWTL